MNKELLKKTFREYKKAAGLDYAITRPDSLGYEQDDVNWTLCEKYGEDSKGIWAKHWVKGYNEDGGVERQHEVIIAHDITEEQAKVLYEVFGKDYVVLPESYDPWKCFCIHEKDTHKYTVTHTAPSGWDDGTTRTWTDVFYDRDKAMRRLAEFGKPWNDDVIEVTFKQVY